MKYLIMIVVFLIIGALVALTTYTKLTTNEIDGVYPVKKIIIQGGSIVVYPSENAQTGELIDLRWFGRFKPRISLEEARNKFGKPNNIRQKSKSVTIWEYWVDRGRIEVWEIYHEEGTSDALSFYPNSMHYDQLLIPQIARYVNPNNKKTSVAINNTKGQLQVHLWIYGNRVDSVLWDARWY